jgi:hypothetical protein
VQRTVLLLAVVAALVAGVGLASIGTAQSGAGVPAGGFEQMDVDPDDILLEVTVEPDGDAVWEAQYRIRLATDDEEQAFEDLRADIEANPGTYTGRFGERMSSTAAVAENATGRDMAVTNTTVTAERRELPQSYGVLTYRFEWSNFAATDGDRLLVGDAVDGLFLDEGSSLIVSWPDGYRLSESSPAPTETRDSAVVWQGPVDFTAGEPRVTLEPEGIATGPILIVGGGMLLVAVAAVAAVVYRRRGETVPFAGTPDDDGSVEGVAASNPERSSNESGSPPDDGTSPSGTADEDLADGESSDNESADDESVDNASTPPIDRELLSNEEQVLRLVEANGGRMKQKRVAEELGWTAAKTSQVVTGLRDEGDLDGFRLGRENVLSLPDYDATPKDGDEDDEDESVVNDE